MFILLALSCLLLATSWLTSSLSVSLPFPSLIGRRDIHPFVSDSLSIYTSIPCHPSRCLLIDSLSTTAIPFYSPPAWLQYHSTRERHSLHIRFDIDLHTLIHSFNSTLLLYLIPSPHTLPLSYSLGPPPVDSDHAPPHSLRPHGFTSSSNLYIRTHSIIIRPPSWVTPHQTIRQQQRRRLFILRKIVR